MLLNNQNDEGYSSLEKKFATAVRTSNLSQMEKYLKLGASPQDNAVFLLPVPFISVEEASFDSLLLLVEYGANLFCRDSCNSSLLHSTIEELDYIYRNKLSGTPSSISRSVDEMISDSLKIIKYLLDSGLSLNDRDDINYTPLHYATYSESFINSFLEDYSNKKERK